ncbi:MAG: hypothetical protein ACK462_11005 [Planctomyces sp.]
MNRSALITTLAELLADVLDEAQKLRRERRRARGDAQASPEPSQASEQPAPPPAAVGRSSAPQTDSYARRRALAAERARRYRASLRAIADPNRSAASARDASRSSVTQRDGQRDGSVTERDALARGFGSSSGLFPAEEADKYQDNTQKPARDAQRDASRSVTLPRDANPVGSSRSEAAAKANATRAAKALEALPAELREPDLPEAVRRAWARWLDQRARAGWRNPATADKLAAALEAVRTEMSAGGEAAAVRAIDAAWASGWQMVFARRAPERQAPQRLSVKDATNWAAWRAANGEEATTTTMRSTA